MAKFVSIVSGSTTFPHRARRTPLECVLAERLLSPGRLRPLQGIFASIRIRALLFLPLLHRRGQHPGIARRQALLDPSARCGQRHLSLGPSVRCPPVLVTSLLCALKTIVFVGYILM